jgi:hypothetical protein
MEDKTNRSTVHRCKHCTAALIPTYAVANEDECVSCRMKMGKRTNLVKGSYACYLNSTDTSKGITEHRVTGDVANISNT